ncbi:hypothetical protein [Salinibaculum rarum]|uniref:hypothetical protein n=1 Tax=Salinibaculum rarum TaxID=3058903 RepID=UPI00265FD95E|nr:hypothetical protein [Salinibaculum sp. KK48]
MPTTTYRCLDCRDETVDRDFNVSHIKQTCDACGAFSRFVHDGVYQQFTDFEATPPDDLDWERLGRMEKFIVAEKMVREGKTVADFEIESDAEGSVSADAAD